MKCKRCGRELKDKTSIELGYGPVCRSKRKVYAIQLELRFNPLYRAGMSMTEQHELVKKILNKTGG